MGYHTTFFFFGFTLVIIYTYDTMVHILKKNANFIKKNTKKTSDQELFGVWSEVTVHKKTLKKITLVIIYTFVAMAHVCS